MNKKIFTLLLIMILAFSGIVPTQGSKAVAAEKQHIIVIDPGHGGEGDRNLGAQYNGLSEKALTLQVANAMKTELEKYENITVYLTRTDDRFISLEDRAAFAKSVNAEFVFSIHFNASAEHNFYGSEVWTSAFDKYYQAGMNFGNIETSELSALGLYQKGVKTKLGSKGSDYYGIIRNSVARDIPCVIIEHAYLDHGYDLPLVKSADFMTKLGAADARSVAKYFGLKSTALGVDYSGFKYNSVSKPAAPVGQDATEPEVCSINVLSTDKASGNVLVEMTTKDSGSPVIYFAYSYDGGQTYSYLQMWDRTKETQSFNVNVPKSCKNPVIVCRAYNSYELFKESNAVQVTDLQ
ncbi:N-acetylmuramoyl-L-alanine amidase family protein [Butyrivibrio sp. X503]|uniref:N-acetylmuramoyl-L-alanine amidase family protein n=1 Tax=Butyrivibrio sp. X503 TaxID=2364878 RepID=UPI00131450B0|nr:N-acetylmuramoyl-L-alanine amidase [Butyrivibrio sp. X503]